MTDHTHRPPRCAGFTLIEIMIVVLIIGLLLAVAIPNFMKARTRSRTKVCVSQLRKISYAKQTWAMDKCKPLAAQPRFDELVPEYIKSEPECPAAGEYNIEPVEDDPICTIGGDHICF